MRLSFLVTSEEADYSCSLSLREEFVTRHPLRHFVSVLRGRLGQGPLASAAASSSSGCQLCAVPYLGVLVRRCSSRFHSDEFLGRRMASTKAIWAYLVDGHIFEPAVAEQFQIL